MAKIFNLIIIFLKIIKNNINRYSDLNYIVLIDKKILLEFIFLYLQIS